MDVQNGVKNEKTTSKDSVDKRERRIKLTTKELLKRIEELFTTKL